LILFYILKGIFVLTCIFLILAVLLQSGKGGDVAGAFGGGGAQSAFGPRGPQKPLEKATVVLAATFMFLALLFSMPGFGVSTVIGDSAPASQPIPATTPAASPVASPAASGSPEASPAVSATPAPSSAAASPSPSGTPAK
jgi:preprotein translocase subunit SecG